jgi:hypothetical protein
LGFVCIKKKPFAHFSVGAGAKLDRDGSKLDTGDGAKLDFWGIAP